MNRHVHKCLMYIGLAGSLSLVINVVWARQTHLISSNFSAFGEKHAAVDRSVFGHSFPSCALRVNPVHHILDCRAAADLSRLEKPKVVSDCGAIQQMDFSDEYFELGCGVHSFTGYFDPSRWAEVKIYGDDGVDVTGAPDSKLLVEGTDNALVEVRCQSDRDFTILIPAHGYAYFDWKLNGSSIITPSAASPHLLINQEPVELQFQDGRWVTPYLFQGDKLTFAIPAEAGIFSIENFSFYTNAGSVIARQWQATDEAGYQGSFTQLITLERPSFSDIQLPAHHQLKLRDPQHLQREVDPKRLGYPAGPFAPHLQELCDINWDWTDEWLDTEFGLVLVRKWSVLDFCGGNRLHGHQYINVEWESPNLDYWPKDIPRSSLFPD